VCMIQITRKIQATVCPVNYGEGLTSFTLCRRRPQLRGRSCFCEDIENRRPECLNLGVLNLYNCFGKVFGFRSIMGKFLAF
jgi:hypothetical protein